MKAISLWQPWASLLAVEAKKYETRSWETRYRGKIAIHAAAVNPGSIKVVGVLNSPIIEAMQKALNLEKNTTVWHLFDSLPRGCIVATADLVECYQVIPNTLKCADGRYRLNLAANNGNGIIKGPFVSENELLFGDFSYGRYAWEFENMRMLPKPIPAKGMQGLWEWEGGSL